MTDTTNGWPGEPGVPLEPEKNSWHWVSWGDEDPIALEWESQHWFNADEAGSGHWCFGGGQYGTAKEVADDGWTYLGPVLSHDQAAALQARVAELEGALRIAKISIKTWGAHSSKHYRELWDLAGDIKKIDAALEGKKA